MTQTVPQEVVKVNEGIIYLEINFYNYTYYCRNGMAILIKQGGKANEKTYYRSIFGLNMSVNY